MPKAITLPVNFLVILILAIILFGFSIYFLWQVKAGAEKIKTELDAATKDEIERLMAIEPSLVVLPFPYKTSQPGKAVLFGIGIRNMESPQSFKVVVSFDHAALPDGTFLDDCTPPEKCKQTINGTWLGGFAVRETKELDRGEFVAYSIPFRVGHKITDTAKTKKADYVFNVCIFRTANVTECSLEAFGQTPGLFYGGKIYQITVSVR